MGGQGHGARKALSLLFRGLALLSLTGLLAAAGLFVWLRTDSAAGVLAALAVDFLEKQGLSLRMDKVEGPLPSQLTITGLVLSDGQGVLFKAESLDIAITLPSLLKGRVDVDRIVLAGPELFRLPELPPDDSPSGTAGGVPVLPVDIILADVTLADGVIHTEALLPSEAPSDGGAKTGAALAPERIFANMRASAALKGEALEVSLSASLPHFGDQGLELAPDMAPDMVMDMALRLQDDRLNLERLRLSGMGINAEVNADARMADMAVTARAAVTADNQGAWQSLLKRLAGLEEKTLGGELRLEAELDFPGLPEAASMVGARPVRVGLRLTGEDMLWPDKTLDAALGPSLILAARLSGSADPAMGQAYTLRLEECRAGVFSASGEAVLRPEADSPEVDTFDALLKGRFTADFEAGVADAARLSAVPNGSGPGKNESITARIQGRGSLDKPQLELLLESPALTLPAGTMRNLRLLAKAEALRRADGIFVQGRVDGGAGNSPGGPITLEGAYQVSLPPAGGQGEAPMEAAVQALRLRGAGLSLDADLKARLDPEGTPAADGTLRVGIVDWQRLAALTGVALSGDPAGLDLRLAANQGKQRLSADFSLPAFRIKREGGGSSVVLRRVSATAAVSDLFGAPTVDASLRTGFGRASFLRWNKGEAFVKGAAGKGDFSLALTREPGKRRRGGQGPDKKGDRERLSLRGAYDLTESAVRLDAFALRDPIAKTGVRLQKTATLDLAEGFRLTGLDALFEPGGRLIADAAFSPGSMKVAVRLQTLSFGFFRLFTGAALPDGEVSATVDLAAESGAPRGTFSVQSRMHATHQASGGALTEAADAETGALDADAAPLASLDAPGPHTDRGDSVQTPAAQNKALTLSLRGGIDASPGPPVVPGGPGAALPGIVWLRGDGRFGSSLKPADGQEGRLAFQAPLRPDARGIPLPDTAAPFAAGLYFKGGVESIWQAVPLPDTLLSGAALIDIAVTGSMAAPKNVVSAYLAGCRFEDIASGVLVRGIDLEARNTPEGDVRAVIAAKDASSGSLAIEADLSGPGAEKSALRLRGRLDAFRPLHRDDLDIFLSGIFGLNGPLDELAVTGDIAVDQGEVLLSSRLSGGSVTTIDTVSKRRLEEQAQAADALEEAGAEDGNAEAAGPSLDLRLRVPRYLFIRGMGLDSEWQGDLTIAGSAAAPSLKGSLKPVRGYLDIFSRTFTFSGGDIVFGGGPAINPLLNLELTYEGPEITALIRTGGTVKKPRLHLESRPPLPEDEVLAHVLFGKRTSDLSRFEAIQLADSLRQLMGSGGSTLDVLGGARKKLGLDMLRLSGASGEDRRGSSGLSGESDLGAPGDGDGPDTGLPALEAGKYINDSIYVGVEQGVDQDSTAVRVEVELYPSVTLQGKSSSEAGEVGVGWKMDY